MEWMTEDSTLLFWLDCEMTGLDVAHETILEIGIKVSDIHARHVSEGPSYVLHASQERLEMMGDWCRKTHQENGLWDDCLASSWTMKAVEDELIKWIASLPNSRVRYLAGSSIWCDRMFLKHYMPALDAIFHYRMLDVSSLKLVYTHALEAPYRHPKSDRHRVMEDIDGSIQEYQYYLAAMQEQRASDVSPE